MDVRSAALAHDELLARRLDTLVPELMETHGFEAWVIDAREYNEDPVARTMLPATWLGTARRRTLLVFKDQGRQRGAISRYPVGSFPSVWDPSEESDQWAALAAFVSGVDGTVAINTSEVLGLADGLTSTEHRALVRALDAYRLASAEGLAIGWLERRLPEEVPTMEKACALSHDLLRRALSDEVVTPGVTTTQDVAWWLRQASFDSGFGSWFHPGVTVQRRGDALASPADGIDDRVILPGDLIHVDFGIVHHGYHTDQQQHGYVLAADETKAPDSFATALVQANRLQEILMSELRPGRTGNEVLAASLKRAKAESMSPVIYTHPIGLHGHAAGSTIGLWDNQGVVEGAGDYPISPESGWSIELAVETTVEEWDGQAGKIMLEEDAYLGSEEIRFLDGRQEELWLIG
jgi:Metallopeptidase family M24